MSADQRAVVRDGWAFSRQGVPLGSWCGDNAEDFETGSPHDCGLVVGHIGDHQCHHCEFTWVTARRVDQRGQPGTRQESHNPAGRRNDAIESGQS